MIAHLATRRIKGNLAIKLGLGSCALRFPSLCGARRIEKKLRAQEMSRYTT